MSLIYNNTDISTSRAMYGRYGDRVKRMIFSDAVVYTHPTAGLVCSPLNTSITRAAIISTATSAGFPGFSYADDTWYYFSYQQGTALHLCVVRHDERSTPELVSDTEFDQSVFGGPGSTSFTRYRSENTFLMGWVDSSQKGFGISYLICSDGQIQVEHLSATTSSTLVEIANIQDDFGIYMIQVAYTNTATVASICLSHETSDYTNSLFVWNAEGDITAEFGHVYNTGSHRLLPTAYAGEACILYYPDTTASSAELLIFNFNRDSLPVEVAAHGTGGFLDSKFTTTQLVPIDDQLGQWFIITTSGVYGYDAGGSVSEIFAFDESVSVPSFLSSLKMIKMTSDHGEYLISTADTKHVIDLREACCYTNTLSSGTYFSSLSSTAQTSGGYLIGVKNRYVAVVPWSYSATRNSSFRKNY